MAAPSEKLEITNSFKENNCPSEKGGNVMQQQVSSESKKLAEERKIEANTYFKAGNYEKASDTYSEAISLNPYEKTYWTNRSMAYMKREFYGFALADANEAIRLDKKFPKGYYRRAMANFALGKYKLALKDFEAVVQAHPNDVDAKNNCKECKKIVQEKAFLKAIAVDHQKSSVADSLDLDSMCIEGDYIGPKLEVVNGQETVTLPFVEQLLEHQKQEKRLHRKYAYKILVEIKRMFSEQPTLVDITIPEGKSFTVCGDIHGQYYDLLNIFKLNGLPSIDNPYLFNGDFVDRGSFSVEVILALFSFKLLYPDHFFMARGNHESETMNQMYGFYGEVKSKYTPQMGDLFTEVFNLLPLAHCINNKVLVMHGGLFKDDTTTLDDLRKIDRNRQPPDEGMMCELLWSDPMEAPGRSSSKRGVGIQFGSDITDSFLKKNNLDFIIRSHEVKDKGYEVTHNGKCITVFSAPNYCDQMGNKGAFVQLKVVDGKLQRDFVSYDAVPHPQVRPMAYANSLFGMM